MKGDTIPNDQRSRVTCSRMISAVRVFEALHAHLSHAVARPVACVSSCALHRPYTPSGASSHDHGGAQEVEPVPPGLEPRPSAQTLHAARRMGVAVLEPALARLAAKERLHLRQTPPLCLGEARRHKGGAGGADGREEEEGACGPEMTRDDPK